jgi:hypothetical protein
MDGSKHPSAISLPHILFEPFSADVWEPPADVPKPGLRKAPVELSPDKEDSSFPVLEASLENESG